MKLKTLVILPFLFFSPTLEVPPEDLAPQLIERLKSYLKDFPQEKIYVHTDRDHYGVGETVFMKFYQFHAHYDVPLSLSGVVYVDLLNSENKVVWEGKYSTSEGQGHGTIDLPQDLPIGAYRMRAYTRWMLNFDEGYLFNKDIFIGVVADPDQKPGDLKTLDFHVEGGTLVAGIMTRLVIAAKDQNGLPVATKGIIVNSNADTVKTFTVEEHGLGSFTLQAEAGESYMARVENKEQSFPLPDVNLHGFSMNVTNAGVNFVRVLIQCSSKYQGDSVLVTSMANGQVYFAARGLTSAQPLIINFPKKELPHGVSTITVFDETGIAQSQRSVFISKDSSVKFNTTSGNTEYGLREEAQFSFSLVNSEDTPVKARLSVAVVDATVPQWQSLNLRDYLALHSDLKKPVALNWVSSQNARYVDQLLITEPFARFSWQQVLDHQAPPTPLTMEEKGITISGRITDQQNQPAVNQTVMLSSKELPQMFRWGVTDDQGHFDISNLNIEGKHKAILKLNDTLSQGNYNFYLTSPQAASSELYPIELLSAHRYQNEKQLANQIQGLHYEKPLDKTAITPSVAAFYGTADKTVVLSDFVKMPDMTEVFRELLPGVRLRDRNGIPEIRVIEVVEDYLTGESLNRFQDEGPLLLINNVPVFDPEFVVNLDPDVVTSIDIVYGKRSIFGENLLQELPFQGILSFTTKEPVLDVQQIKAIHPIEIQGFSGASSIIKTPETPKEVPDLRDLLYWEPDIHTNEDGTIAIKFRTSDIPSEFRIEIQGVTDEGIPINYTHQFKTKLNY